MTSPAQEAPQAKAWRERRHLTVSALAELTGYSIEAIYQFERGVQHNGDPISDWVWLRYKRCCQGVESELVSPYLGEKAKFQW